MKNPIPSPLARPAEYAGGLVGVILLVLLDAGTQIPEGLLVSLPILATWITTGIVAWLTGKSSPEEVDASPDG